MDSWRAASKSASACEITSFDAPRAMIAAQSKTVWVSVRPQPVDFASLELLSMTGANSPVGVGA